MQALKITLPGCFWDSQIYSGRLYLFTRSGDLVTVDWDKLILDWPIGMSLEIALECAFGKGSYMYGAVWNRIFKDAEIKKVMGTKFSKLAKLDLEVSKNRLSRNILQTQQNKFPFPHSDSVVYYGSLFVVSLEGVHKADCADKKRKFPIKRGS